MNNAFPENAIRLVMVHYYSRYTNYKCFYLIHYILVQYLVMTYPCPFWIAGLTNRFNKRGPRKIHYWLSRYGVDVVLPCHYNDVILGQSGHCSFNRIFRRRYKKPLNLRITGRWRVNPPHKWPETRKMFPYDDVIMVFVNTELINI